MAVKLRLGMQYKKLCFPTRKPGPWTATLYHLGFLQQCVTSVTNEMHSSCRPSCKPFCSHSSVHSITRFSHTVKSRRSESCPGTSAIRPTPTAPVPHPAGCGCSPCGLEFYQQVDVKPFPPKAHTPDDVVPPLAQVVGNIAATDTFQSGEIQVFHPIT